MRQRIREIVQGILRQQDAVVPDDVDLFVEVGLDSMQMMEFISRIERCFGIRFSVDDLELENFSSIQAVVALLERKHS